MPAGVLQGSGAGVSEKRGGNGGGSQARGCRAGEAWEELGATTEAEWRDGREVGWRLPQTCVSLSPPKDAVQRSEARPEPHPGSYFPRGKVRLSDRSLYSVPVVFPCLLPCSVGTYSQSKIETKESIESQINRDGFVLV